MTTTVNRPAVGTVVVDDSYDQRVRWRPGERLDHLFEARCDQLRQGQAGRLAVDGAEGTLTYDELDAQANRLSRHLSRDGVRSGDRVGLLFDRAAAGYVAMLAVLKLNSAYVPLDPGFPPDRLAFITADAGVKAVLTESHLSGLLQQSQAQVISIDKQADAIAAESGARLTAGERSAPVNELCYVIYTSGSTGRPKGVPIEHSSICNFVRVAAEVYGLQGGDRVYQGMTIAFDFSVEEIWVPWMVGATLVPKPPGGALVGDDLRDFLLAQRVSALCCVPTLLASIEDDIPGLRFLLVSGEACPQDLIARWYRPERRFLNVYGPTETTVTATWAALHPDRKVTIGVPLPTYAVVILDPQQGRALPAGQAGEIGISGIGLSPGYLNRPDLTAKAFVQDVSELPTELGQRVYRTGDLGRVDENGEIEYLGRIDTQVKIRGYRIELTEIESVLLLVSGIAAAVVEPYQPRPDVIELVGYYVRRRDAAAINPATVVDLLRDRLPRYMVPAYLEELNVLPMLPSDKVDRKRLPAPQRGRLLADRDGYVPPAGPIESALAIALQDTLAIERVSADSHFFDDLGGTSILMAQFCAQARRIAGLEGLAMRDIYQKPTIQQLAAAVDDAQSAGSVADHQGTSVEGLLGKRPPASTGKYVACGLVQVLVMGLYATLMAWVSTTGLEWLNGDADTFLASYERAIVLSGAVVLALALTPIAAKWLIIGRWTPREFPAWGRAYLRFWVVRMLIRINPMALFVGSPLYVLYLRALGARIGPRVTILTPILPICTDLLTIGANSVISKNAVLNGYRAQNGWIQTGRVTLGQGSFVGETAVLDIDTSMGQHTQLGHASTLTTGQHVPDGQHWHGCPAERTTVDYQRVPAAQVRWYRPVSYTIGQLAWLFLGPAPLLLGAITWYADSSQPAIVGELLGSEQFALGDLRFYGVLFGGTLALFVLGVTLGLLATFVLSRLTSLMLTPGRVYPLYGIHYAVQRWVTRLTNRRFYLMLFGDSSYIVGYLSRLGYRLRPVLQTGTNFGTLTMQDSPRLCAVGTGTMISDGASFANAEYSSSSFRLGDVILGQRNYVGNDITLPTGARIGDNCLLANKVLVPLEGPVRENVGLLGSPAFEIPRTVNRDTRIAHLEGGRKARSGLAAKSRYNRRTMALFLLHRWFFATLVTLVLAVAFDASANGGWWITPLTLTLLPYGTAWYLVFVERLAMGFKPLQPQHCSVYDSYFWLHERYWKLCLNTALAPFDGTPFKSWFLRGLGVRVGRRLLDDGSELTDRSLASIGDDCTLNFHSVLQSHSLEDGVFKSDRITVGDFCTVGTKAFIHYGTTMGAGAILGADSFLMKGEQIPPDGRWHGNPAGPDSREPAGADSTRQVTRR